MDTDPRRLQGALIARLKDHGWAVEPPDAGAAIPAPLLARYGRLPADLLDFITAFSSCTDPSGQVWFVSAADLGRDEPFRVDEFERISLAAAESDAALETAIRTFWDQHFPLFLSVAGSYQYFALSLAGPTAGCVVHGAEPEFEECSVVAGSLSEFLDRILAALDADAPAFPYSLLVPSREAR